MTEPPATDRATTRIARLTLVLVACCLMCTAASVTALVIVLRTPAPALTPVVECDCPEPAPATEPGPAAAVTPEPEPVPDIGQSVGLPTAGVLHAATPLHSGEGYVVRNPATAYGTETTIEHLTAAIAKVRAELPTLHPVLVGDVSLETGGDIAGHLSHESGRDVDLGLYYRKRRAERARTFVDGTKDNLHFKGTLAMVHALAATHDLPGGVEWVLLDYKLQRLLYDFARKRGASDEELQRLFQYPRGTAAQAGLLRHFPGHRNHMHVRFRCTTDDRLCRSPDGSPLTAARRTAPSADAEDARGVAAEPPASGTADGTGSDPR